MPERAGRPLALGPAALTDILTSPSPPLGGPGMGSARHGGPTGRIAHMPFLFRANDYQVLLTFFFLVAQKEKEYKQQLKG